MNPKEPETKKINRKTQVVRGQRERQRSLGWGREADFYILGFASICTVIVAGRF